jgi:hypothetical protein
MGSKIGDHKGSKIGIIGFPMIKNDQKLDPNRLSSFKNWDPLWSENHQDLSKGPLEQSATIFDSSAPGAPICWLINAINYSKYCYTCDKNPSY